jgi:23S rRNA pseudouridine1911/1915/1917 synthase
MGLSPLQILFEDNHCLALAKPAGRASAHFQGHEDTIDRVAKAYLKEKYHKPGNVFLGIVHRLDRLVSGVLLFARTSKAAARLSEQFRENRIEKVYWAIVHGTPRPSDGILQDWLLKDKTLGRVDVVPAHTRGARQAVLCYSCRECLGKLSWLELRPQTGRTHQLRVQLAQRGWPIYGDKKYGATQAFGRAIALHARSLTFVHPIRAEPITLTAALPDAWHRHFERLLQGVQP